VKYGVKPAIFGVTLSVEQKVGAMQMEMPPVPKDEHVPARYLEAALALPSAPTASELAGRLGVEPSTISRWRTKAAPMSRARWFAVLAVLGLPVDWRPLKGAPTKNAQRGRGRPRTKKAATIQ
jgi:hypothetical protein